MRNLLLFFLALLAIHFVRRWLQRPDEQPAQDEARRTPAESEQMVECARCGLLVPESEAVREAGRTFCSPEHARLGAGEGR